MPNVAAHEVESLKRENKMLGKIEMKVRPVPGGILSVLWTLTLAAH